MYPAPFEYHVPSTVAEAVSLLGKWQDEAKLISGSRLQRQPAHLFDYGFDRRSLSVPRLARIHILRQAGHVA